MEVYAMIQIVGSQLSQWDTGRSISLTNSTATHIHLANKGDSVAVIMELSDSQALIPNYLLQTGRTLLAYAVQDGVTLECGSFVVHKRERPENYVYDDDHRNYIYELIKSAEDAVTAVQGALVTAESAVEAAQVAVAEAESAVAEAERVTDELKTARDNGEFNGPKGDKGDPGKDGNPGKDGINGKDGTPGTNGKDGADGKNGADGKDGTDGYTPVRGVDYWTDADKEEIKSYVDEAILGGAW
jgi:hypothetical protein